MSPKSPKIIWLLLLLFPLFLFSKTNKPDSLRALLKKGINDRTRFEIYIKLGSEFRQSSIDSSLHYHQLALKLAEAKLSETAKLEAENELGFDLVRKNDLESGHTLLKKVNSMLAAMRANHTLNNETSNLLASNYEYIGVTLRKKDSLFEAIDCFDKALDIALKLNNLEKQSALYNSLGQTFYMLGSYPKSLDYCLKALKVNEARKDKQGIASSTGNVGILFKELGDYKKALAYFETALQMNKDLNNLRSVAINLGNIGVAYDHLGNYDLAFEYYAKAAKINEEMGSKEGLMNNYNNMGLAYHKYGRYEKAIEYYNKSMLLAVETKDNYTLSHTYIYLSNSNISLKKYDLAQDYLNKSNELLSKLGALDLLQEYYESQSTLYTHTKQYDKALINYKKYIKCRDSVVNEENLRKSIQLESTLKYAKRISEDSLLHAKELQLNNTELERKNAEIKADRNLQFGLYSGLALSLVFLILIYNRFKLTKKQKNIIHMQKELVELKKQETETQKHLLEEKQKEIIDSINYAKRIQFTLLAHDELLKKNLPEHFVLFKPKDIVSGDFYWAIERYDHETKEKHFYFAVCDSTGHGVPGAFMGLLNTSFLNEAISEKGIYEPGKVFDHVRSRLIGSLSHDGGGHDGMDAILIRFTEGKQEAIYSASHNQPLIVRNGEILELDYDKMPIGKSDKQSNFSDFTVKFQKGDTLYLYTDGYADQFGGEKGRKLKEVNLKKLLVHISSKSATEQKEILHSEFEKWRGGLEQVDDVCIVGIKF